MKVKCLSLTLRGALAMLLAGAPTVKTQPTSQADGGSQSLGVVQQALVQYDNGNLIESERLALKALSGTDSLSNYDRFNLHKLLAFIAVANDDEEVALKQFAFALRYNPTVSPDPVTWSPKVRRVFEKARGVWETENKAEQAMMHIREADVCRRAALASLYLPGYGQHLKGETGKGLALGAAFAGTALTYVWAQTTVGGTRDRYLEAATPDAARERWREYRDRTYLVNLTALASIGLYSYAFMDALYAPAENLRTQPIQP